MNKPKRIQRRRTKGWRMPPGAVYVGRPSQWGNPFRVGTWVNLPITGREAVYNRARAVVLFRDWFNLATRLQEVARVELRGKDLVCWCPLDEPCHADVLLEWANS